ncbi:hypothetical protein JCM10207_006274 [Rhodosporidiobolus poonsookiae]
MLDRVLITGAHGTGKTTLANALLAHFAANGDGTSRHWTLIEETARKLLLSGEWTQEDFPRLEWEETLLAEQLKLEKAAVLPYIADRCLLDPLAYTALHHPPPVWRSMLASSALQPSLSAYRQRQKTLIVHLLPVAEFWQDDGVRPSVATMDEWWRLTRLFEEVLKEAGVEWVELGEETVDLRERVDQVVGWMRERES